jgi:uncharacterized protein (DUF433 family)
MAAINSLFKTKGNRAVQSGVLPLGQNALAAFRFFDRLFSMSDVREQELLQRITHNPAVMGGKACIRGMRITAGMIVGMIGAGVAREEILQDFPDLEPADIDAALTYAAWRASEREVALPAG